MTGEELKSRRKKLSFTQEEFANELKVATNTVARWERDERAIPPYLDLALETIERKNKTDRPPKVKEEKE